MGGGLSFLDWSIVSLYLAFALGVGIYFSKRASSNTQEYFLSGRSLPWWLVGTSMVATTFASDTPLAITEMVRRYGLWRNWFWWRINAISEIVALASSLVMAFFFLLGKHFWPEVNIAGFELATMPFHIKTLIIVPISIVCWLTATYLTKPESQEVLNRFYRKVCPGGWWRGIDPSLIQPARSVLNSRFVISWIAGILFIFGATLGLGYFIFQSYKKGFVCIFLFIAGGIVIWMNIKRIEIFNS